MCHICFRENIISFFTFVGAWEHPMSSDTKLEEKKAHGPFMDYVRTLTPQRGSWGQLSASHSRVFCGLCFYGTCSKFYVFQQRCCLLDMSRHYLATSHPFPLTFRLCLSSHHSALFLVIETREFIKNAHPACSRAAKSSKQQP